MDWQQLAELTGANASGGAANGVRGRRHSARLAAAAAKEAARGGGLAGARLAGMAASFLASGAVHELIFW